LKIVKTYEQMYSGTVFIETRKHPISIILIMTRCSAIAERPRCRVSY